MVRFAISKVFKTKMKQTAFESNLKATKIHNLFGILKFKIFHNCFENAGSDFQFFQNNYELSMGKSNIFKIFKNDNDFRMKKATFQYFQHFLNFPWRG